MRTSKQNREDKRSEQEHHAEYCFAQAEQEQHEADYLHELDRGRGVYTVDIARAQNAAAQWREAGEGWLK